MNWWWAAEPTTHFWSQPLNKNLDLGAQHSTKQKSLVVFAVNVERLSQFKNEIYANFQWKEIITLIWGLKAYHCIVISL